ncbi:hypothetical protein QFZ75_001785 [Streptomyces sp. V3I8]|uniref:pentapeptide repeat-containing protein n=1 Tax=Streptomyces sp. V3I8 TaxID=3042279 RepID=UPI00277EE76F|nr:hypothetical protein [Streptomyces sp. V3I8]MDQ1035369.1 hypothetical protein [Streptomyces sp. V3I8]
MTIRRKPRPANERELRLWGVRRALALTFAAAVLAAGSIFYTLVVLLDFQEIDTTAELDAKTLFDLVKLSFGVVAGAGALVALVVAYRRQRVDEAGAHRETTRLHTERFTTAVSQLGNDSPAVRLGGVHALAGLADDAPTQDLRQTCIDVLCAYLRLPSTPDPGDLPDSLPDGTPPTDERRDAHQDKKDRHRALREVRHTILRLVGDHYRIPKDTHRSWQDCDLDLRDVTIDGVMDFDGAEFSGGMVNFSGAKLSDGSAMNFNNVIFSGGRVLFDYVIFSGGVVSFINATFSGGTVNLKQAEFSGSVLLFHSVVFSGATVNFDRAAFTGGTVLFDEVVFNAGTVNFARASGNPPTGLRDAAGPSASATLTLPPAWLS